MIYVIAYEGVAQELPYYIEELLLLLFAVPELDEQAPTVQPFLPERFAVLVKESDFGVVRELGRFFY